jgi:DNA-directed RNA polymerase specialized sigma24 family protein
LEESMEEEADLVLLGLWLDQGNERAFAILYNRHLNPLVGWVHRRYGEEFLRRETHRVCEAVHDTWMRMRDLHQAGRLDQATLCPLLITLLNHRLIDEYRRSRRSPAPLGEDFPEVITEATSGLQDDLMDLRGCLDQMPPQHRQTYELLYTRGLKLAEAAREMGLASPSGASARREGMLAWLRNRMGVESPHEPYRRGTR